MTMEKAVWEGRRGGEEHGQSCHVCSPSASTSARLVLERLRLGISAVRAVEMVHDLHLSPCAY